MGIHRAKVDLLALKNPNDEASARHDKAYVDTIKLCC